MDDERPLAELVGSYLERDGFEVTLAGDGAEAVALARSADPDVVVLDLGLPGLDGVEVCRRIRAHSDAYVVMLTARTDEVDTLIGLSVGADDYVTKPFSMDELLARVRAHLRRAAAGTGADEAPEVETADFVVDLARAEVRRREGDAFVAVHLTPTEWRLVEALVRERGRLVSQRDLLRRVWGPEYGTEANYLRVFMGQVRAKLEPSPSTPRYFHTEPGLGYRFEDRGR